MNIKADTDSYAFLTRPDHMPRGSLSNHVARQLREAIINLQLKPGTMLDKTVISNRLGISRSPISDAVSQLQNEGLVEVLPQRGSIVSLVSVAAVQEYIFVRCALEGATVKRLAEGPPPGLLAILEENIEAQRDAAGRDDKRGFHKLDLQFHEKLLEAVNYPRMKALVDVARNNLDRARQLTNSIRRINVGIEEHAGILAAIRSGDGDAAAQCMDHHLDGIITEVRALARAQPELFAEGELTETADRETP